MGYKSGFLGATFNLGQFFGSLIWSFLADIFGRRCALLTGVIGTLGSTLFFGFSLNFIWACLGRFMWGILNGNICVAKAYLSEILTNDQQSLGFSGIGVADATGVYFYFIFSSLFFFFYY